MDLDEKGLLVSCGGCGKRNRIPYERLDATVRCGECKTALALPARPIEVTRAEQFPPLTGHSTLPVFVDFWAPWCGPCKMVAPEIEKVAASANGRFLVAKLDTDAVPEVAQAFKIQSIPTMAVFYKGQELERTAGARPAAGIISFIEGALRKA